MNLIKFTHRYKDKRDLIFYPIPSDYCKKRTIYWSEKTQYGMSDYNSAKQNRSNKFCNKVVKKYLKKWLKKMPILNIFWTRIVMSVIISRWVKYDDSWRRRVMLRMNFLWIKTWREDREYDRKPERRNRRLEIGKTWNWRKSSGNDFKNFYSTLVLLFRSKSFSKLSLEKFRRFLEKSLSWSF